MERGLKNRDEERDFPRPKDRRSEADFDLDRQQNDGSREARWDLYTLSDSLRAYKRRERQGRKDGDPERGGERPAAGTRSSREREAGEEQKGVEPKGYKRDWDVDNFVSRTTIEKDRYGKKLRLLSAMRDFGGEKATRQSEKSLHAVNRRRFRRFAIWGKMRKHDVAGIEFQLGSSPNAVIKCLEHIAQDKENPLYERYSFLLREKDLTHKKILLERARAESNPSAQRDIQVQLDVLKATMEKKAARKGEFRQKLAGELQDLKQERPEYRTWVRAVFRLPEEETVGGEDEEQPAGEPQDSP